MSFPVERAVNSPGLRLLAGLLVCFLAGCRPTPPDEGRATAVQVEELEARFRPGLHTLMLELQLRHANLWFAGNAANWELADYQIHEMEELLERIAALHPTYNGAPIAELIENMADPAVEALEEAVATESGPRFLDAYDLLTARCNACHAATDREALVIQRPTSPPLTNLRFEPLPP